MAKCPVCRKAAAPKTVNPGFPFCSERCKLLDLGKWLGESYRIPVQAADEEDDELPSAARQRDEADDGRDDA